MTENLKDIIKKEYLKCALDCEYFLRKYSYIQVPNKGRLLFELYGYQSWIDVVAKLKRRIPAERGKLKRLLYEFGIKLKNGGYSIELIENVKQSFISLLKIYDI